MSYKTKLKNKHSIIPKNLRRFYNYNQNSELKVFLSFGQKKTNSTNNDTNICNIYFYKKYEIIKKSSTTNTIQKT